MRQLDQKTHQVEDLEKSTTQLDEEAKQLYKQFTQNREICERYCAQNLGVLKNDTKNTSYFCWERFFSQVIIKKEDTLLNKKMAFFNNLEIFE